MTKSPFFAWGSLWGRALLDILFPPRCHCCKAFVPDAGEIHLCRACVQSMPAIASPQCTICGLPFATEEGIDHACSSCISEPPPFSAARAPLVYTGELRTLVHRFKYERKIQLRRPLAKLVAERLQWFVAQTEADLLVPVPLHPRRLRERGFNQAVLLAEVMASQWGLPLCRANLSRIRWTHPQMELSAAERANNVRGAFAVKDAARVEGKRIILVDDVYTTGSTIRECSRTLGRAGAAGVFAVTVARAIRG